MSATGRSQSLFDERRLVLRRDMFAEPWTGNFHPQFSSTHPYLESVWQAAYAGINRANSVIERVSGASIAEDERVMAELSTVRDMLRVAGFDMARIEKEPHPSMSERSRGEIDSGPGPP